MFNLSELDKTLYRFAQLKQDDMIHISILEGYIPGLSAAFPLKNVSAINTPIKSILDCGVPLKKFGEQNSS